MDDPELHVVAGGPSGAPRPFQRAIRIIGTLFVISLGFAALAIGLSQVPQGTQTSSLVIRGLVGLGIGCVLIVVVRRMLRALVSAPPAPPRTVDTREADVVYVCTQCGTRVRLEVATSIPSDKTDGPKVPKAPRHCGEEMELQLAT